MDEGFIPATLGYVAAALGGYVLSLRMKAPAALAGSLAAAALGAWLAAREGAGAGRIIFAAAAHAILLQFAYLVGLAARRRER